MKWSISMKKNEESKRQIDEAARGPIYGPFGIKIARITRLVTAKSEADNEEFYFVEMEGSPLYFLDQLIWLRYIWRSNDVIRGWVSEFPR